MNPYANMMLPNWDRVNRNIDQAFEAGMQAKQQNALAAFAQNPDDPKAQAEAAKYNPQMVMQARQQQQKQQQDAAIQQLRIRAAQGDPEARTQLAGSDFDAYKALSDRDIKRADEGFKFVAGAAYDIIQRPEAERAALWDQYIQRGMQMGYQELGQYLGKYDPTLLNGVVAKAGEMKEFQGFQQPKYVPVGEGGLSGFQYGRPIMQGQQPQNFGQSTPPEAAVAHLRSNPSLAAQFDEKYGPGASHRILGGTVSNNGGGFPDPLAPR